MRIATFNIESLDLPVESRTAILRPALDRLQADVVCLQEINGQKTSGRPGRSLIALDQLLEGTRYATYHRAETTSPERATAASVHNLVTLSRFPILGNKQVWHDLVPPAQVHLQTTALGLGQHRANTFRPTGARDRGRCGRPPAHRRQRASARANGHQRARPEAIPVPLAIDCRLGRGLLRLGFEANRPGAGTAHAGRRSVRSRCTGSHRCCRRFQRTGS